MYKYALLMTIGICAAPLIGHETATIKNTDKKAVPAVASSHAETDNNHAENKNTTAHHMCSCGLDTTHCVVKCPTDACETPNAEVK